MGSKKAQVIGFIGLGVMGEPICRNLARKSGAQVLAFDLDAAPLQRLAADGVQGQGSASAVMAQSDTVFLSLPSGAIVAQLCRQQDGLLASARPGHIVVDLGTSSVDGTRQLAAEFAARQAKFADAPVARTRAAAQAGTLAVMVGADPELFGVIEPLIATFASDIALCGPVGCGQVLKILNNMILFETVVAISEAKAIGEKAGVDASVLFDTLANGSADSFALRNHGMKAVLPGEFPERAFSVHYARKDLQYALQLADDTGVDARSARVVDRWFAQAIEAGLGEKYHPVISRLIARGL
ncbi:NAD(P)-dependent oxidoreductase [Verminephrobacter eiseniae]|uniref:6-phosphogluconate dehydrogenase, NAD-binding n=1 Tax=Verminephrobacter eiseniae (strain EF01-2) TaxID=391735 RepID=A1WJN2_VEREI|nr:NAD(P)-dependent oxidoreductase [Verminephrobacter eiseniae]ABM57839.1 6-phosphogluconate dehydrogenase, NAD-binding [Verminephrobacter eiseniae EF01-2]MCW5283446.1 NAD(P)-dependent oxidoreductase [Verminephrobacter eiseniae]MCW5301155.1 NAD(P)-dependent oxidoreductase [Verminephrobacter eiseniae]MCW8178633.1 NAD(P)-dependent oxidoreductase [Verminephrobacter eiseniae]MCW8190203.1 NAD(P)-dependent oxidoreductase [Verminephrobacter eiseniae]